MKTVRWFAVLAATVFVIAIAAGGCGKSGGEQKSSDVGAGKPAPEVSKAEMAKKMSGFVEKGPGKAGGGPPAGMKAGAGGAAAPAKTGE